MKNWWEPNPPSVKLIHKPGEERPYVLDFHGGGTHWHEVRPKLINWCTEQYGHRSESYNNPRWIFNNGGIRFRDEKDAMFFMLKWA